MGLFDFLKPVKAQTIASSKDAMVIEQLEIHGSNLSKPHNIDFFFFYLPDQITAENLAQVLSRDGFEVSVSESTDENSSDYTVQAVKSLVPDLSKLESLRICFEDLAKRYGGEYDGWGTNVVE
tara:strand:- start:325 stop:693 length:369 start_codon:yes stop_codon:yes gene_type:complete